MDGSTIERFVPIDLHFCGNEVIIVDNGKDSLNIEFTMGSGMMSYNIGEVL